MSSGAGFGAGTAYSPTFLAGGELSINFMNFVEAGFFYDHFFSDLNSLNHTGILGRVGLGPLAGLFVDAKIGFSPSTLGLGVGAGLGYHINNTLGLRAGPRLIAGGIGSQIMAEGGLILSF
jgi:hypothetical protein